MGGDGGTESVSETSQSTTTTTETITTIGDIGLVGDDAIALAAVLETGAIGQTRAIFEGLQPIIQATGEGYNRLIGAAGPLTGLPAPAPVFVSVEDQVRGFNIGGNMPLLIAGVAAVAALLVLSK